MNTCPRCSGTLVEPLAANALSRTDNETYVCASCGTAEAMENWEWGYPAPQSTWASQ